MRAGAIAALVGSLLLVSAPPSGAHEEHALHALTVLDRVTPDVEGVEVRVVHLGAPALAVSNSTGRVLEVTGEDGEPFLRIGPRGVFANAESPTTYKSIVPSHDDVPSGADPSSVARWVRFTDESSWSWFDPRLVYSTTRPKWSVSMRIGNEPMDVRGGFEPLAGHGHFVTTLEVEDTEGLDIRLVQGPVPAIYVHNESVRTLHVTGPAGEPFLRIGPDGVLANVRSPSYYSGGSLAIRKVPRVADASASPRWRKVSDQPTWGWLEHSAALDASQLERDTLGSTKRVVHTWTPRLTLGDDPVQATGRVVWIPPHVVAHGGTSGPLLTAAWSFAGLLIIVGASVVLRRRRAAAPA